jgi:hypothetical protein
MFSLLKSIFKGTTAPIWSRIGQWPLGTRTLGAWAAIVFVRLKDVAPYALIELLLPGGSVLALTLWFYRRRQKAPARVRSLNALL